MRLGWLAVVCAVIGMLPGEALAEPLGSVTEPVVTRGVDGFGPDAQLVGGLGFGLERKLDNFFLARARLGALYATAPWIVNLGLTAEVGAIAGFGWGAELELSRGGKLFGNAGVARVDQSRWLAHVGLGFTIFGLEWQHVFDGPKPHNALLLEVRLPLGLWWLQKRQEKAEAHAAATSPAPQIKPRTAMPRGPTRHAAEKLGAAAADGGGSRAAGGGRSDADGGGSRAAGGGRSDAAGGGSGAAGGGSGAAGGGSGAAGGGGSGDAEVGGQGAAEGGGSGAAASGGKARAPTAADVAARDAEVASRLVEATTARERGDRLAEAFALSRAYALKPDPVVALQLAAAELALGKPRGALADWQRIGDPEQLPAPERERAVQIRQQLTAALAPLRVELSGGVTDRDTVWIDGVLEPLATQGYDIPLDPGAHTLEVRRGERVIAERNLDAKAGALQRLSIELPRD